MQDLEITFVDKDDNVIGSGTKEHAWEHGDIHRIVRLMIFNSGGKLLIQKRADNIKNMPGRWDQSAAGHVDAGEEYVVAAKRELEEEVGIKGIELREVGKFTSNTVDETGKIKNRFNMVYEGVYDGEVNFDREAVQEIKWIDMQELGEWMRQNPKDFTQGCIDSYEFYLNK